MISRQKKLLSEIKKEAVRLDWEQAFGGKSYGNRHLFRVNKIARYLLSKEGGDEFIILAGAWVHDVSLAYGNDYDIRKIEKYTRVFLKKYTNLTKSEQEKIIECAMGHESGGNLSLEAQMVHDADVVDKSGMLGVIRHIWKMTNMLENRVLISRTDLDELERHLSERQEQLFTKTTKQLVIKLNLQRKKFFSNKDVVEWMKLISKKAMKGVTSDNIANNLYRNDKSIAFKYLKDQLNCNYLK